MPPSLETRQQLSGGELGELRLVVADLVDVDVREAGLLAGAGERERVGRFAVSPGGDTTGVRHVAFWAGWWAALFGLWLLLAGQWNPKEIVAAAVAAAVASSVAELARTRTGFSARLPLRALRDLPQLPAMVVVDFGIVVWALLASAARREVVRGSFLSRELGRKEDAAGVGPRAWVALAASYSPNAYVVGVEADGTVLLHDLVPSRKSESPA